MVHKLKHKTLLLGLLIFFGTLLHFYNINWGAPFYFNPDERNIASAVSQLQYPTDMNPRFFAYGSLPIYSIYFTGVLDNIVNNCQTNISHCSLLSINKITFPQAIIISRFFSALFATLLIPLLYSVAKKITHNEIVALGTAALTTFSTGLIQFAHFGTFEMWLTFFTVILFWYCLDLPERPNLYTTFFLAFTFGVLIATKVSHAALLPVPILASLVFQKKENKQHHKIISFLRRSVRKILVVGFFISVCFIVYVITNPFTFLDYPSFKNSINYESSVALGTMHVFYTAEFYNKVPVLFQLLHVYPFLINPVLTILLLPSLLIIMYLTVKKRNYAFGLLILFFLFLFCSQAFIYAKWTRYMVPTLPFIYLMIMIGLHTSLVWIKRQKLLPITIILLTSIAIIFSHAYFITAFVKTYTTEAAAYYAKQTIPANAAMLTEPNDLGITPFNSSFNRLDIFNFYELDNSSVEFTPQSLRNKLATTQYIILPSQRIMKTRLVDKKHFPNGYKFYTELFGGKLGFKKVYETPCDIFCKITYINNPVYRFEQTANVFDRPEVYIFKKVKS